MMLFPCCLTRSLHTSRSQNLLSVVFSSSTATYSSLSTRLVPFNLRQLSGQQQQQQQQQRYASSDLNKKRSSPRPVPLKFVNRTNTKSIFKTYFKLFVLLEVAGFLGSYYVWKRMNSSQDFRFYMSKSYPTILEGYYQIGEKLGNLNDIRSYDNKCWQEKQQAESSAAQKSSSK